MTIETTTYTDFDLHVERVGKRFRARATKPTGGVATVDFSRPFTKDQIELLVLRLGRTRQTTRAAPGRAPVEELRSVDDFGKKLFDKVFTGEVRAALDDSLRAAHDNNTGLRIRLRLSDVPDLADLPWEYLAIPTGEFLALSRFTPIVRYLDVTDAVPTLHVDGPLRMLVMVSNPRNSPVLDVEGEWALLEEHLAEIVNAGQLTIERMEDATLSGLRKRLQTPDFHIFHFIGHGGFDTAGSAGLLLLEDESDEPVTITGKDLAVYLRDLPALRLAVLNSCEGSRSATTDPFAGTAQTLVRQARLPAVVAMQFEITDTAATDFARGFYSALGAGFPVDAAVAEGRKEILAKGNRLEWGTPSLFMRSPDGRIFDLPEVERAITPAVAAPVALASEDPAMPVIVPPADSGPGEIPGLTPTIVAAGIETTSPPTTTGTDREPVPDADVTSIDPSPAPADVDASPGPSLDADTTEPVPTPSGLYGGPGPAPVIYTTLPSPVTPAPPAPAQPVVVPTPSTLDRARAAISRHRLAASGIAALAVVALLLGAFVLLRPAGLTIEPSAVEFGEQALGTSRTSVVTIRSSGWREIDNVFLRGPDAAEFGHESCAEPSLSPLASCAIDLTFAPQAAGSKLAELVVVSGDIVETVTLRGTGATSGPDVHPIWVEPGSVDFALVPSGTPETIEVSSFGEPVTVTSVTLEQLGMAFSIDLDGCSDHDLEFDTCSILVGYTPEFSGPELASLTIESDGRGDPIVIALSGPGVITTPTAEPTPTPTAEPTPTPTPTPTVEPTPVVELLPASVLTDCITYDPSSLSLEDLGATGWRLNSSTSRMLLMDNLQDAQAALALAQLHTQRCFIGRDNKRPNRRGYIATFWTGPSGAIVRIPPGAIPSQDCIGYDPNNLSIEDLGATGWRLNSGPIAMVVVDNQNDAIKIMDVARNYRQQCFIGRDNKRENRFDYIEDYWN